MGKGKCAVCNEEAHQQCAGCKTVYYCGKDHQKAHWKQRHRRECCSYKVIENATYGRHVVATRDIQAGEIIIKEPPLIMGPKVACSPVCLGCHKTLQPTSPDDDVPLNYYKCSGCGWPLCAPRCETNAFHIEECQLMRDRQYSSTISYNGSIQTESAYCIILPLRCLLLEPQKLKQLLELQSHLETRIKTPMYQVLQKNLIGFIRTILGLNHDEDTIMKVAAILDTNAFEIRHSKGNIKIRGIFPKVAMLSHDCKPNTKHVFIDDNFTIVVSAVVNIKKDDIITTTYTQTLWGTQTRRSHLNKYKCFLCTCNRCSDPTELGLYIGGIVCSKCKGMMVPDNALDDSSKWQCDKCSHSIPAKQMKTGNESLTHELEAARPLGIVGLEKFIDKYMTTGSVLHSSNTHILQAKYALSQLYSNSLQNLTNKQLKDQVQICEDLLYVADKIEPGLSRFRGLLLYDLQAARLVHIKREYEDDLITEEQSQETINEVMTILGEATTILQTEPDLIYLLQEKMQELSEVCK